MVTYWLLSLWVWYMDTSSKTGQTYAVIVGISDYQALSYATGDLRFADRDARQVVQFLKSKPGGEVPGSNIRLLINRQATCATIQQALAVFRRARPSDRVILYFSGHGLPDSFVPYDVVPGNRSRLLTHRTIKAAFHESKALTKLCIADACLSGSMTQPASQRTAAESITKNAGKGSNVAMLLASRSTQDAVESSRLAGGTFTHYLLKGLNGRADLDHDHIVTIRELHRYVSPKVRLTTKGKQAPVFYGRFSDNLALSYL
ncbi:caspase family protein [Larkinella terrae]|uniref:Caspase family protein n=1 Tax=Larkinella terrae TaxID=2025311 RepID=A0A7K0EN47_9BACT|nr:caspase family protein [Larkinella terrae]MRS62971.1 caspase family protein [Larkinella terrae]